ncbi:hypothetical protein F2Q69_00036651 [Brassica cretica]|uniref:Uncharacterized protein n=1 Tax=Brassica cretica TaxID=69181 RepID=A0A8S9SNF6_BRACR|nr:hypothetical protein F2Q69_00036651 [Brassica cretica]
MFPILLLQSTPKRGPGLMNLRRRKRRRRRKRGRSLLRGSRNLSGTLSVTNLLFMRALLVMLRIELSLSRAVLRTGGSASEERRIKFRDRVEFKYAGGTPLVCAPSECAELIRQIRGGAKDMPPVKDLLFKDAYVDAARTKSDGSMNYVVELYDTALKETISKLKQSDILVRARDTVLNCMTSEFRVAIDKAAAEQSRLLAGKKAQKEKFMEKFGDLKDKFKNAGEEGGYGFKASEGGQPVKGLSKLQDDGSLQSQVFGTKKCLEALKESGIDIPQETIDMFAEQEKEFDAEAKRLTVGGIPKELLCLIDTGTAASLQTPTISQGDHATGRSNEPNGRELGESSVQGHEVVRRVERSEDATAPLVLDPAPSMANLVVSEESLIPILGVSDANPTPPLGVEEAGSEPVDLLELSDSSAEEEGREKSDERVPGDNPQGTEEGVIDEVENPPASTTDEAGGASDQLEARDVEEDPDRAEN